MKTFEEQIQFFIEMFDSIIELCEQVTSGNCIHKRAYIRGIARNCAEGIKLRGLLENPCEEEQRVYERTMHNFEQIFIDASNLHHANLDVLSLLEGRALTSKLYLKSLLDDGTGTY